MGAVGSRMLTADVGRHYGIAGRQSHLRQVARIARLFRRESLHKSLQWQHTIPVNKFPSINMLERKSNLRESSFGDAQLVNQVNGNARERKGCENPADFDGPSRVGVVLRIQRYRINQSADENKL